MQTRNAIFEPVFGLVLHTLLDLGVTSDVAITAWVDSCEDGRGGDRVQGLLSSRWTKRLLETLDEESDDEDDEGDAAGDDSNDDA